jgi:diguanylate cyclase (GGDEF)-like protein
MPRQGLIPASTRLRILLTMLFFLLAILGTALALIARERETAIQAGADQVQQFLSRAEVSFNQTLLNIDILLASVDEMLALGSQTLDSLDTEQASLALKRAARMNLLPRYIALLDGKGKVLASSDLAGAELDHEVPASLLDEALQQPLSTLVLSDALTNERTAERVLFIGRHLRLRDGNAVVVVTEVSVEKFVAVLAQGLDLPGLEFTVERADGRLLLAHPQHVRLGRVSEYPADLDALRMSQGRVSTARLSGVPSLVASRPAIYGDLWITGSLPMDRVLAGWMRQTWAVAIVGLLFATLVLLAAAATLASLRRLLDARSELSESQRTLDQALASMDSGFIMLDEAGRVLHWNARFLEFFPWAKEGLHRGMPFEQLLVRYANLRFGNMPSEARDAWIAGARKRMVSPGTTEPQVDEAEAPDGRKLQIVRRFVPDGGLVVSYHDITALQQARAEIESLAFFDPLTGLANRRLLLDRLAHAVATCERSGRFGALLFLDLDKFKTINDTLGHEVGDDLLRQIATRLQQQLREVDTVARLGGDEFVVMVEDLSGPAVRAAQMARDLADKLVQTLAEPYLLAGRRHSSSCSMGATLFGPGLANLPGQGGNTAGELLKQADIAMYQAKAQRGNRVCFFDPGMQVALTNRAQLEADIAEALRLAQFELHLQPQYDARGQLLGAESLIRWQHPQRGLVSPAEFILVAEERDLIAPIGEWVISTACQQLARWQKDSDPRLRCLSLSVNVSARQFRHHNFVSHVARTLVETGARPTTLKLELTESVMLEDIDDCMRRMNSLRELGVGFALDDFGTGYSSLTYLTRLPLEQLKIDQSFVRNLGQRNTDQVIVQTIIVMARSLGLQVIAEGVETEAQRQTLQELGCDQFQGYLLGRPMPIERFEALARASTPSV